MSPFPATQTLDPRLPGFAVGIRLAANKELGVIDGSGFALLLKTRLSRNRLRCCLGWIALCDFVGNRTFLACLVLTSFFCKFLVWRRRQDNTLCFLPVVEFLLHRRRRGALHDDPVNVGRYRTCEMVRRGRDLHGRYCMGRGLNDSDVPGRGSCVGDLGGWHLQDGGNLMKVDVIASDVWGNDARDGGLVGGDLQDSRCTSGMGSVDFDVGYLGPGGGSAGDVWGNDARDGGLVGGDLQDSRCTSGTGSVDFDVGYLGPYYVAAVLAT